MPFFSALNDGHGHVIPQTMVEESMKTIWSVVLCWVFLRPSYHDPILRFFFPHHLNLLGPDDGQGRILIRGRHDFGGGGGWGGGGQGGLQPPPSSSCIKRASQQAHAVHTSCTRAHEHQTSFLLFSLYWSALVNKARVCENLITATQSRISSEDWG